MAEILKREHGSLKYLIIHHIDGIMQEGHICLNDKIDFFGIIMVTLSIMSYKDPRTENLKKCSND